MSEVVRQGPSGSGRDSVQALLSTARTRVFKRLERAVDFPLLVISSPTGFGKSTVLREFFKATGRPYRCLEPAPNQGDLLGFMRAFANSLGDLVPALLTSFLGVYDRMHSTDEGPKKIADWAAGHLTAIDVTFVIDGLQNVTDDRLFGLLIELIDQTVRTNIRWVLVCESADRFPIARWLAND